MDSKIKTWLFDILQSIIEIESYFEDRPKKFDEYINDIKTKRNQSPSETERGNHLETRRINLSKSPIQYKNSTILSIIFLVS